MEFHSPTQCTHVVDGWSNKFFTTNSSENTFASLMKSSKTKTQVEAIVKFVDKNLGEEYIADQLETTHGRPTVQRFKKKDGFVLSTIKVDFQSPGGYTKALNEGVTIDRMRYKVEPYIKPPMALQCYKCKGFGHTSKWCTRRRKCRFCAGEDHEDNECHIKGNLERYRCINCNGTHSASYHKCPDYINHIQRSISRRQENHD
jgi:hypothetical protein